MALAAELSELAVAFLDQSRAWSTYDADGALACIRAAEDLHRQARVLDDAALLAVDLDRAQGLAEAAGIVLGQLVGARRFLASLNHGRSL